MKIEASLTIRQDRLMEVELARGAEERGTLRREGASSGSWRGS